MDTSKIAGAEREAALSRLKRELKLADQRNDDLNQLNTELRNDNDELTRTLQNRARRAGESTILMDRLNNLRQQLRDVERMRDSFKKESQVLQLDLDELRAQLAQQSQTVTADSNEAAQLKEQLAEQQQQSRQQLTALQDELDQALKSAGSTTVNSDQALELEALRQENAQFRQNLGDRVRELQTSQETGQLLEDELEDANREIDELRRQLEKQAEKLQHVEHNLSAAQASGKSVSNLIQQPQQLKTAVVSALGGLVIGMLLMLIFSLGPSESVSQPVQPVTTSAKPVAQPSSGQILRN